MNQKLWTKVLASLLVMTLTFANFILLGVYATNSYATIENLERQETVTNNENVTFDAYFKDEKQNTTHTVRKNMSSQDLKLYVSVQVKKGYLKNAQIQVLGEDGSTSNLKVKSSNEALEYIESIDETTNTIGLKQVNSGTQLILEIPVIASKENQYDLSNFSKLNDITLTGNYVGDAGKETKIQKTIQTRNEWSGEIELALEQQLIRFIPYQVKEKTGTILQTLVRSGIKDNTLPIEETMIQVLVPQVNGENPNRVNVAVNGTLATNGKTQEGFTKDQWNYDQTTGMLTITVKNEAQENQVSWLKTGKDEFIVTYLFDEKVDTLSAIQNVTATVKAYNTVETKVSTSNELNISQNEVLGQIVTGSIYTTEALSKGYLYTKAEKETIYQENVTVDISDPTLVDELIITQNMDYFVNAKGEISQATNDTYYKTTKISKTNFETILGEEGSLKITTLSGEELATFNKDTQADENGDYVFQYEGQQNQILIKTSGPVETGKLEIRHEKALKGNTNYNKTQVESFKTLKVAANIEAKTEENIISNVEMAKEIALVAPTTKVEASVSNSNLSTVVTNENVELRVVLKTSDISCDLYKNPTVEIVLPNYISHLNIKDINLLFDKELQIKDYNTYVNENGNVVIRVNIVGEQTGYSQDEISKGANLIINTDITLKQLTPTTNDVMKVAVTNELVTLYEQTEYQVPLKAVAPTGMVTTNTISGYNAKNETVTSISSQEQIGKLDAKKEAKIATVTTNIINNYQDVVKNVSILGRIPTSGSKHADTLQDFGSNLALSMASAVTVSGMDASKVEIYYSTNLEATKDVSLASNGWTKTVETLENVKSYLIVINGDMTTGTLLNVSYQLAIPENLNYNMGAYSNYVVYFDHVTEAETTQEKAVATKVGLTTGDGPELQVTMSSDIENGRVEEKKIINYTVFVKNVGKSELNNVKVTAKVPNKTVYTWVEGENVGQLREERYYDGQLKEYSQVIPSIKVGETKTITYQVETKDLMISYDENKNPIVEEVNIETNATATVEGFDDTFTSNTLVNELVQGYFSVNMYTSPILNTIPFAENQELQYVLEIENVNAQEKNDVIVTNQLPDGLKFVSVDELGKYDETTNTILWDLGTIGAYDYKTLKVDVVTSPIQGNDTRKEITNKIQITTADKTMEKEISIAVEKAKLTVKQSSETAGKEIAAGDKIIYNIQVKNEGAGIARNIKITDILPEGVTYESTQYSVNGKTYDMQMHANGKSTISLSSLGSNETVDITITVTANALNSGDTKQVTNKVTVTAKDMEEITANEVTHTIITKQTSIDDPSIDEPVEGTYSISGIAWLDANGDGKRDENETRLANIPILLINADNGQIVLDKETGKEKKQQTGNNGEYIFANLEPGNYMVIFLYDAGNYGVTLYKQAGVNDNQNSDAVQMNVTYEGTTRSAGVSDKLTITNENIANIDLGLIESLKFDLKLDKVISKITVNDEKGTKVHEYKDEKLAKLDLDRKTVNGTTIMIEYKIRVTNEGGLAGYAKKIVDYMPSDMKFSSEINQDWYTADNGTNLYNTSLANTLILPGETKEITLLLTKKMTESNMGIINNTAEIAESYNDLGLEDIDSIVSNKVQNEDDYSGADAIIGTKTGEIYLYITLTLSMIALFGTGIYFINEKVLKRM